MPTARGSCQSFWMEFPGLLINPAAVLADFQSLAVVTLIRDHKFNTAVAIPVDKTVHKICNPQAALLIASEWPAWVLIRYLMVRNTNSEQGLSLETLGLEKDLSTPSSSSRSSRFAARIALRLSAWRINSCLWLYRFPRACKPC